MLNWLRRLIVGRRIECRYWYAIKSDAGCIEIGAHTLEDFERMIEWHEERCNYASR